MEIWEQEVYWEVFLRTTPVWNEKARIEKRGELNCNATNISADPIGSSEAEMALRGCPELRQGRCAFELSVECH